MCSPSRISFALFLPFHTTKQNKYPNQHQGAYGILNCTINVTLTDFISYLTHKMIRNRKNMSHLVFSPCHYGLSCLDMGLMQIPWCWLATSSPGAGLILIPLFSLADWNTQPFIIKNGLISIPGQSILTMHFSCQNSKLSLNFLSLCGDICMITPLLRSLWLIIDVFFGDD